MRRAFNVVVRNPNALRILEKVSQLLMIEWIYSYFQIAHECVSEVVPNPNVDDDYCRIRKGRAARDAANEVSMLFISHISMKIRYDKILRAVLFISPHMCARKGRAKKCNICLIFDLLDWRKHSVRLPTTHATESSLQRGGNGETACEEKKAWLGDVGLNHFRSSHYFCFHLLLNELI